MRLKGYGPVFAVWLCVLAGGFQAARAATFGSVVAPAGGASYSDIVLDRSGTNLYLVNTAASRVEVYSLKQKAFLAPVATDPQPVAAATSTDGRYLYVTTYTTSTIDVIDLTLSQVVKKVSLPAPPEGIAVGSDGRALISVVSATNTLWIYDPAATVTNPLATVPVAPPAPPSPVVPSPVGRVFVAYRSHLLASPDGRYIIGLNALNATATSQIVLFVYEVASGTVLRSREVANLSSALSVAPDGSKFMAGSTLFDTQTLQVLGQENAANAPFAFPGSTTTAGNFNLQANQGGSVFSPDGTVLYAAFNIAASGAASSDVLLLNDPDNLLIQLGLQMPENLAGKMVIDSAGANIYAISDSGFTSIPVGAYRNSPIAQPSSQVVLMMNDQCAVYSSQSSASDAVNNGGKGKFTVSVAAAQITTTIVTPVGPGGGGFGPGGGTITTTTTAANGPSTAVNNSGTTPTITFRFNNAASASPGTTGPNDYVVTSSEAINVPGNIHTFQNYRSSESQGTILPVQINASAGEGLTDLVMDSARQRLYIANSGMNRIEIFDMKAKQFLAPIKVGQLPHAMALGLDGNTLYVANTGGESISVVDLTKGVLASRIAFPALPFNAAITLSTPQSIVSTINGPLFVNSDGTLWKVVGGQALPRALNTAIFGATAKTIPGGTPAMWNLAATPGGEYALLVTGAGTGYLYDYTVDDFTLTKQIHATPLTGYTGPLTAGPGGAYYSVGGTLLNSSLSQVAGNASGTAPSGRQVAAVAAISANSIAMFTMPARASATAAVTDAGQVELYNPANGATAGVVSPSLEGAPSVVVGTTRVTANARSLAVDTTGGNAYVLTATGLSIVPLVTSNNPASQSRPGINNGGVVSLADYTPGLASGGLMTLFGSNLGTAASGSAPLPTSLGGTCVTLNGSPIPLSLVTPGQINAAIPPALAAGRYPLVIHSLTSQTASISSTITVAKYAPAIFAAYVDGQFRSAILHLDGTFVTPDNPTTRDERLMIFATGLGPTTGSSVLSGAAAPSSPLAQICSGQTACAKAIEVFFGPTGDSRAPVIVEWAGLAPSLVGVYQINVYVPGTHLTGDKVPVAVKIGGVTSSLTGPVAPTVAIQ